MRNHAQPLLLKRESVWLNYLNFPIHAIANGDYLFSGYKGKAQAFVKGAAGIIYNGDQGATID